MTGRDVEVADGIMALLLEGDAISGHTLRDAIASALTDARASGYRQVGEHAERMRKALEIAYDDVQDDAVAKLIDEALVAYKRFLALVPDGPGAGGWRPIETAPKDCRVLGVIIRKWRSNEGLGLDCGWGVIEMHETFWGKTSHVPLYGWNYGDDPEDQNLWSPTHRLPSPPTPEPAAEKGAITDYIDARFPVTEPDPRGDRRTAEYTGETLASNSRLIEAQAARIADLERERDELKAKWEPLVTWAQAKQAAERDVFDILGDPRDAVSLSPATEAQGGDPVPAPYYPAVIEYPEAGRVEFVLRDGFHFCDKGDDYDIICDGETREVIGFAWPLGTNPATKPVRVRNPVPAPDMAKVREALNRLPRYLQYSGPDGDTRMKRISHGGDWILSAQLDAALASLGDGT